MNTEADVFVKAVVDLRMTPFSKWDKRELSLSSFQYGSPLNWFRVVFPSSKNDPRNHTNGHEKSFVSYGFVDRLTWQDDLKIGHHLQYIEFDCI